MLIRFRKYQTTFNSRAGASRAVAALALALCPAPPAAGQDRELRWHDVELPKGFYLDLATGAVTGGGGDDDVGLVSFVAGRLFGGTSLRSWLRPGTGRTSQRVARGAGVPASDPIVEQGSELLFELDAERWGYLQVRAVRADSIVLEYALEATGADVLARDPPLVEAQASRGTCHVSWLPSSDPEAEYLLTRRRLGSGREPEVVAVVKGGSWVDEDLAGGALMEYRVARVDSGPGFGARARAVEASHPGDWPLEIGRGTRLDLLSGATAGPGAHIEFTYVQPPTVGVRPLRGTRIQVLQKQVLQKTSRGSADAYNDASWELPDEVAGRYRQQIGSVPADGEMAVFLPEGVYCRLSFDTRGAAVSVRRQVDLTGGRLLPRPPAAPEVEVLERGVSFAFSDLPAHVRHADLVSLVVERELGYVRDDWEEVFVGAGGQRACAVARSGGRELVRFRFRHRLPWDLDSRPTEPVTVLLVDVDDAAVVEAMIERSMGELTHADFERRLLARGILESLGEAAWPRLRAALASDDVELVSAARDLLIAASVEGGDHVELILRTRAAAESVGSEPPATLFDSSPPRRAWALVHPGGSALGDRDFEDRDFEDWDFEGWARVLSQTDPDEGVGRFAGMLLEAPVPDRWPTRAAQPYALIPARERRGREPRTWRDEVTAAGPVDLLTVVREAVDAANPRAALATLQVVHELEHLARAHGTRWPRDGTRDAIELALRLIERYRESADDSLLAAAESLVSHPGTRLAAMRELSALRLASEEAIGVAREEFHAEGSDLEQLEALLATLSNDGEGYMDVILAPGDWRFADDAQDPWLDIRVDGLRLVGGPGVRLHCGLRVQDTRDVVLDGLQVSFEGGAALMVTNGSAVVRDCHLTGMQNTITAQQADLELYGTVVSSAAQARSNPWSLRVTGRGVVLARECLFETGTIMPGSEGFLYLDRCVVDGGPRAAIQGIREGEIVLRESLVRGEGAGLYNVSSGILEGIVIDVAREPLGRSTAGLQVCPVSVHVVRESLTREVRALPRCPLQDR